jgi:hypothetical protein
LPKGYLKDWQKLKLGNVVDVVAYQSLNFTAVWTLQWQEAANIKQLQKVRLVRWPSCSHKYQWPQAKEYPSGLQPPTDLLIVRVFYELVGDEVI